MMAAVTRSRVGSAGGQCLEIGAKAGVTEMADGDDVKGERFVGADVEDLGELRVAGVSVIQVAGAVVHGECAGIMAGDLVRGGLGDDSVERHYLGHRVW